VSDPVTHSAAAWMSIFAGAWGDKHGVTDPGNSFDGNHLAEYPSFFARLEAANSNWIINAVFAGHDPAQPMAMNRHSMAGC
jgi:hypothetical protein